MGNDIQNEKDKCPTDGSEIFQRIDDTPAGIKKKIASLSGRNNAGYRKFSEKESTD